MGTKATAGSPACGAGAAGDSRRFADAGMTAAIAPDHADRRGRDRRGALRFGTRRVAAAVVIATGIVLITA
jgi:hypothetical protein